MNDKLLNKAITLSERTDKQGKFGTMAKIKDEKGLTYTVYQTKKDGSNSVAWEQLEQLSIGDIVQIGYSEEVVSHPQHGNYTARTIRSFNKDIRKGMVNASSQGKTLDTGENRASQDNFGLRLAIHGMVNGMLGSGSSPAEVSAQLPELFTLEEDIEKILRNPQKLARIQQAPPSTDLPKEPSLDEIPF